ncbi:hypothetical protein ATCC90586_008058 [Pythium insidiosum]|nr:hypothetical protein ATCC90586_008058 [Pythium insidiosum]
MFKLIASVLAASVALSAPTVDAKCGKVPFVELPTAFGLDTCIGNHVGDLLGMGVSATFQCPVWKFSQLAKSQPLKDMAAFAKRAAAAPHKISSLLYEQMKVTGEKQVDAFCKDWRELVSPCAGAILPKLMRMVNDDTECCGGISDLFDQLNMIVPPNVDKASVVLNNVIDGVNHGTGSFSRDLPLELNAGNLYNYVRWNVNLLATDKLDGSMLAPQVWSWAVNEPSLSAGADVAVFMALDGRWRTSSTLRKSHKACFNAGSLKWNVVPFTSSCPPEFAFVAPRDPYQNYALFVEMVTQRIVYPVVINVQVP